MDGIRKERRGFASMSPEKQREIASKGGRAAHEKGTAHEWTADEARAAGRKGGQISRGGRGRLVAGAESGRCEYCWRGSCIRNGAGASRLIPGPYFSTSSRKREASVFVRILSSAFLVSALAAAPAAAQAQQGGGKSTTTTTTSGPVVTSDEIVLEGDTTPRPALPTINGDTGPVVRSHRGNHAGREVVGQRLSGELRPPAGTDRRQPDRFHRRRRHRRSIRAVRIVAPGPPRSRRADRRSFQAIRLSAACRTNIPYVRRGWSGNTGRSADRRRQVER